MMMLMSMHSLVLLVNLHICTSFLITDVAPKLFHRESFKKIEFDASFDPFNFETVAVAPPPILKGVSIPIRQLKPTSDNSNMFLNGYIWLLPFVFGVLCSSSSVLAADGLQQSAVNLFDPQQFQPVCPASDGVYGILKVTANSLVGQENVVEYGPLIASVLLRVRLELCVLESFLYEAIIPFVSKKGLSWVLPLHETVETFLAGTIFAIASNFILLGSTKILSVLLIYADVITGMPTRFLGNTLKNTSPDGGVPRSIGTIMKLYGDILGTLKTGVENTDTFVGRYLVIFTTFYITFKFLHFKVFNDIIPF